MTEKNQNKMLRCVLFSFFVSGFAAQPLGSFIPFLRQAYGLSYEVSGALLSCQSLGNMVTVLLTGFLPYYLGRRKTVLATAVWMAVAYVIFASGMGAPALLIAAFLMTGLARGGNSNFANTMVSTLPGERAVKGYNLLHGCFAVGALLAPLLLVFMSGKWVENGWRIMAAFLAAMCGLQLIVYGTMPIPAMAGEKKGIKGADRSFFKKPGFWMGVAMLFFYISTEYAVTGWLVTYFQDSGRLSGSMSQLMNSLFWLLMFLGRMAGAALIGKISREKLLLFDGLGLSGFFLLMLFAKSTAFIVAGITGVGLFMSTIYTCAFSFGSEAVKGNDLGCSLMLFSGSVGGIATPALVGLVAEKQGISAGMGLVAAYTGLLLLVIILSVSIKSGKGEQ